MARYRILCLSISFCTLFMISCAVKTAEGFTQAAIDKEEFVNTYFADASLDYVYKAGIDIYGRHIGGILIAKQINDSVHRVVFTTEFGNSLFDFEIGNDNFKVNYIADALNRKVIINTLKHDFTLLFKSSYKIEGKYTADQFTVYKSGAGKNTNYLFTDLLNGQLIKMVHATKSKEKIIITYNPKSNTLAQNIGIDHKNIKLKIVLDYINQ